MTADLTREDERHRAEVRWVCANPQKADSYIRFVEAKRGPEAAERLRADAREQYRLGNRGAFGDWRC